MNGEIKDIVDAINNLRQPSDVLKDYVIPIGVPFFSSLVGWMAGYWSFHYQEYVHMERGKVDAVNKWMILMLEARTELFSIKSNYYESLTDEPVQRMNAFPQLLAFKPKYITAAAVDLFFIVPKREKVLNEYSKILDPLWLSHVISNYNLLQDLIIERNRVDGEVRSIILNDYSANGAAVYVSFDEILSSVGRKNFIHLFELTERVIILLDDLIEEFSDYIKYFPQKVANKINKKAVKGYAGMLIPSDDMRMGKINMRSTKCNYAPLVGVYGMSVEDLNSKFKSYYNPDI
jgi:hypothetical protein